MVYKMAQKAESSPDSEQPSRSGEWEKMKVAAAEFSASQKRFLCRNVQGFTHCGWVQVEVDCKICAEENNS